MQSTQTYPEAIPFRKGARGLDTDIWISLVLTRPLDLADAAITKVEHYQSLKNPQRDFLAIYITHPIRPTIFVIERRKPAVGSPEPFLSLLRASSSSLWASLPEFTISIPTPEAKKPLSSITQSRKDRRLLCTLEFPRGASPSDMQLAILLQTVHGTPPLLDSYARSVFDLLKALFMGRERGEGSQALVKSSSEVDSALFAAAVENFRVGWDDLTKEKMD